MLADACLADWATDTINIGTWETASSIIAVGLTWRDAIPIMVVGKARFLFVVDLCTDSQLQERVASLYPWYLMELSELNYISPSQSSFDLALDTTWPISALYLALSWPCSGWESKAPMEPSV